MSESAEPHRARGSGLDADDQHGGLPIKLGPCSNGEYLPLPPTPLVRETIRRTNDAAERVSRRLGMSRRRFLSTASGSALTLLTLAACSSEENGSGGGGSGPDGSSPSTGVGGTFSVPESAVTEPESAVEALGGDEFVFDVQGHLLDYDLAVPAGQSGFFGGIFPQANCGEDDARACFAIETFLDLMFLQSDTSALVLSALPIRQEFNPLSHEVMAETKRVAAGLCSDARVLAQGGVLPAVGELSSVIDGMAELRDEFEVTAWKIYTHQPNDGTFWLDDHEEGVPQVGTAFLDRVAELGPNIVSVHKGLRGLASSAGQRFADPRDIGPAAERHPDIRFVVYHSGYETDNAEGVYDPEADAPGAGIDRLLRSMASSGIGPGGNVYAELGSTWRNLMSRPTDAAHALGKLLVHVGEDNIVWGTDSIWYGSPQDQIQAFRAFEITAEFQERFGYPALTKERKAKILGRNGAALYGIEPERVPCPFTRDELQSARDEVALPARTFGPRTNSEVLAHIAAHGGMA